MAHSRESDGKRSPPPASRSVDRTRDRDYDGPYPYDGDRRQPPPPASYRGGPSDRDYGPERDERGYGRSRGPPGRSRSPPQYCYDSYYDRRPPPRGYRRSYGGTSRSPSPPPRAYHDSRYDARDARPRSPPPRRPRSRSPPPRSYDYDHPAPRRSFEGSRPPPRAQRDSYTGAGRSPSPPRRRSRSPVESRSGYSTAPRSRDVSPPPKMRSRRDSVSTPSEHDRRQSRPASPEQTRGLSSHQSKYASGPGPVPSGPRGTASTSASASSAIPTGPRAAVQRPTASNATPTAESDGQRDRSALSADDRWAPSARSTVPTASPRPSMTPEQIVAAREAQVRAQALQRSAQAASKWLPRSGLTTTKPASALVELDKEVHQLRATRLNTLVPALFDASIASTKTFVQLSNQTVEKTIAAERTRVSAGSGDWGGSVAMQMGFSPARQDV